MPARASRSATALRGVSSMGAKLVISKIVADAATGKILGFQCIGAGNVNRQVAEMAMG